MSQHSSRGTDWEKKRQAILVRDNYRCAVAGCNTQATHVDHIIPKSVGGTDEPENLQAMCQSHNLKKGSKVYARTNYYNNSFFNN